MNFPIAIDDFKKVRERDCIFVDKTALIKEFIDDKAETRLICRPRRFGKTLNLSMLNYFFTLESAKENRALFEDTEIYELRDEKGNAYMPDQGQYPTVFLSLKDFKDAENFSEFIEQIGSRMAVIYEKYGYLFEDGSPLSGALKNSLLVIAHRQASKIQLKESLFLITLALHQFHGKQVMVFLDEYDAPIQAAFMAQEPFNDPVIQFMADFLGSAFKSNEHLKRGLLTGIAQISLTNLFSGMNNVPAVSLLSEKYAAHFGFSKIEVIKLISDAGLDDANIDAIEEWYNGYDIGHQQVYNPWSVINCLDNHGEVGFYWNDSGEHGVIKRSLLSSRDSQTLSEFARLVAGDTIQAAYLPRLVWHEITNDSSSLWNLLLNTGYLKLVADSGTSASAERKVTLKIPNNEVKQIFSSIIRSWGSTPGTTGSIYKEIINFLRTGDIITFGEVLQRYLLQTASYYDFGIHTSEKFYHVFFLGLMFTLEADFIIESNKESGIGRPDIALIPRDKEKYQTGIIFELKRLQPNNLAERFKLNSDDSFLSHAFSTAHAAVMRQITSKHYPACLQQHHIDKALHVSMVFYGKQVRVKCESMQYH